MFGSAIAIASAAAFIAEHKSTIAEYKSKYWHCEYCRSKLDIYSNINNCKNCGAEKPPAKSYYEVGNYWS